MTESSYTDMMHAHVGRERRVTSQETTTEGDVSPVSKERNKHFDLVSNLPRKMSRDLEGKQSGKTVLIPVDGSENSKRAFQCKYFHLACLINYCLARTCFKPESLSMIRATEIQCCAYNAL